MEKFFYRVESGDTVFALSRRFNIPVTIIVKLNNLKCEIEQGDLLYLERGQYRIYKVRPFESAESVAQKFNTTPQKILSDNGVEYLFYGLTIMV